MIQPRFAQDSPGKLQRDAALWRQFQAGDKAALGDIATTYYKRLFSYGSKFSKDTEFVKDCVQDVFLDVWAKRDNLSQPDSIKLYLLVSLRRRMHRAKTSRKWINETDELSFVTDFIGEPSIETTIIEEETEQQHSQKIRQLIHQLSKRQQEIIYLRFYENLDNQSIADLMDLSRQGVANLLWRALRELKSHWQLTATLGVIGWFLL